MDNIKTRARDILDNYLEVHGHRKTPERYSVLDAVYSMTGSFTLSELDAYLRQHHFRVCRATLYNAIRLFVELRLVVCHRLPDGTRYEAGLCRRSHIRQVCSVCGRSSETESAEVSQAIDSLRLHRFRKDGYTLYIYGICSTCAARETRMRSKIAKTQNNER